MKPTRQQIEDTVRINNEIFENASPSKKRVMIAQDVYNRLLDKQYTAQRNRWTRFKETNDSPQFTDLQKALVAKEIQCNCCALGGLMASCVVFKNKVTVAEAINQYSNPVRYLNSRGVDQSLKIHKYFDPSQLEMIETAFEGGKGYYSYQDENASINSSYLTDKTITYLMEIKNWSRKQAIKAAKEQSPISLPEDVREKCIRFSDEFKLDRGGYDENELLLAIMSSIIVNNGSFVP